MKMTMREEDDGQDIVITRERGSERKPFLKGDQRTKP